MNRSKSALRLLVPNVGTILVVALMMALMLLTQRTWAGPAAQGSTSGVMNY